MRELDDLERHAANVPCDHETCGGHDLPDYVLCAECGFLWRAGSCSYNVIWCQVCQVNVCYEIGPCCTPHTLHQNLIPPTNN